MICVNCLEDFGRADNKTLVKWGHETYVCHVCMSEMSWWNS